ncbi:hypothetical protein [Hymenobacter weizhouensis]|uniref:hypothetical protein n=1 Tax=Hymenobacter sp. YIM 151500-1 TaxID=2987689 RepID=UPI0022264586|nr:hypothetical protein [Hymenobacter sp. YIM 151500-1]UYZ62272.1 hypothetical protein OIS53_14870 [Hymenobacter sp. YIM 151500-1]
MPKHLYQPRLLSWWLCGILLLAVATSGCHRNTVAYRFRPAPPPATAHPKQPAPAPRAPAALAAAPAAPPTRPALAAQPVTKRRQLRQEPVAARQLARPAGQRAVGQRATRRPVVLAARRALVRPGNTVEVGLGTTVLGVLGLIVGPISLLGLLIWGGPVWAILLGLSALAVLVAWLDPFG